MSIIVPLGSQAATTTNATLGAAVTIGQVWRIYAVNIQQPIGSDAKNVWLAIGGTAATNLNVKRRYALTAGQATAQDFPNIAMVAGEQVNILADGTTAQAIVTVTIAKDVA